MPRDKTRILRPLHPRVVYVFDFDETLAPRTTDVLLRHLGVDPDEFARKHVDPRVEDGWEERLAEAHALTRLSRSDHGPITEQTFAEVAEKLELYPGVPEMFDRVTSAVHEIDPELDLEFHLLTAGFIEVPSATSIADRFTSIVGGQWAFGDDGAILFPQRTVGHYDKVRHLLALAKGLDSVEADRRWDIDSNIPEEDWHVPFEQMIFVGDGDSDLPAFDLMETHSGVAIAVQQAARPEERETRDAMREGRRVVTLLQSSFEESGPLLAALCAAGQRAALWTRMLRTGETHI